MPGAACVLEGRPRDLAGLGWAMFYVDALLGAGGTPLDGPRHIWWNFVSSSPQRIERAKLDWRENRFAPVPGDEARVRLPDA